jgi:hypothetical protein
MSGSFVNKHFFKFPKNVHQTQLWKDACKIDEVQNIESWKIYEHSANEDFVLLEELLFSEDVESVVMQDETFVECSCHQATTSTVVCKCKFFCGTHSKMWMVLII